MQIIPKKHWLLFLAALSVVLMGFMAYSLSQKQVTRKSAFQRDIDSIEMQSSTDDVDSIEKDIVDTDLENLDKELQNIENELDQTY